MKYFNERRLPVLPSQRIGKFSFERLRKACSKNLDHSKQPLLVRQLYNSRHTRGLSMWESTTVDMKVKQACERQYSMRGHVRGNNSRDESKTSIWETIK